MPEKNKFLKRIKAENNLTIPELTAVLGKSEGTVIAWLFGVNKPRIDLEELFNSKSVKARLAKLKKLKKELKEI